MDFWKIIKAMLKGDFIHDSKAIIIFDPDDIKEKGINVLLGMHRRYLNDLEYDSLWFPCPVCNKNNKKIILTFHENHVSNCDSNMIDPTVASLCYQCHKKLKENMNFCINSMKILGIKGFETKKE